MSEWPTTQRFLCLSNNLFGIICGKRRLVLTVILAVGSVDCRDGRRTESRRKPKVVSELYMMN